MGEPWCIFCEVKVQCFTSHCCCHVDGNILLHWTSLFGRLTVIAPGRCSCNIWLLIFKLISRRYILNISHEIALRWMPRLRPHWWFSTLVQVMAWCLMAPSHYLNQCCPISMLPYGIPKPQGVNNNGPVQAMDRLHFSGATLILHHW